jgi:PAS domain S-box-containing protein
LLAGPAWAAAPAGFGGSILDLHSNIDVIAAAVVSLLLGGLSVLLLVNRRLDRARAQLVRNIEELTQAQTDLMSSEEKFRALISNTSDIVMVVSPQGTILFESPAVEAVLGYRPEERVGRSCFDYVHPDDKQNAMNSLAAIAAAADNEDTVEVHVLHKNGEWRLLTCQGRNALGTPGMDCLVISARDITESRLLEEKLTHAQRMEAIGHLTGGIAHDFNNILTIVSGNLDLLREDLPENNSLRGLAEAALQAVERGANLTRRLLAFARRQTLNPAAVRLGTLMEGLTPMLGHVLGERITLTWRLEEKLWPCLADAGQLENALINLAVNARDAMDGCGELTVAAENFSVTEGGGSSGADMAPGDYVAVTVSDTGEGFDPALLDHAFEPFFTTKAPGEGSGLGLSMVYGFVKQLGGHARIASTPGKGTSVTLYLPRAGAAVVRPGVPADTTPAERDGPFNAAGQRRHVLVVEDADDVRSVAVGLLEKLGYRATAVTDAGEALEALEGDGTIDLVFIDIGLPGAMSGVDLADHVQRDNPEIPALLTTGHATHQLLDWNRFSGPVELIGKPYSGAQLAEKLRQLWQDCRAAAVPDEGVRGGQA